MEEHREEGEFFGEPVEEARKGSSKTETLVSDSGVCGTDENLNNGGSETGGDGSLKAGDDNTVSDETPDVGTVEDMGALSGEESSEKTISTDDVERTDAITEPESEVNKMECEGDAGTVEVNPVDEIEGSEPCNDEVEMDDDDDDTKSEVKSKNVASHEIAEEEESVISAGNEVTDGKAKCEVEDNAGDCDAEQNVQTGKSQQSSVDGETSVSEDEAGQEKESAKKSEEDDNKMDVDSKHVNEANVGLNEQGNPASETKDAEHSESAQVPGETTQLSTNEENQGTAVPEVSSAAEICKEEEITNVSQKEENGEAMEIDFAAEGQVEKDVKVGGALDNDGNESAGGSMAQTQDVPIAEADRSDSNVVKEMETDERRDNADMASDPTGTIESADSANPNCPTEDAAPGEVEPVDHNALFDPSSDITNYIDFGGDSSWSGNIQDLKTETGNVSLKEDKKVATVDCSEALKSVDATVNAESRDKVSLSAEGIQSQFSEAGVALGESPAAATDFSKEASDAMLGSGENQEDNDQQCLDKKTADQQDTTREGDDIIHEAPIIDPTQKEDTEMEENPNNSDYADDGTDSDIKTNGVKRKADVLSEDSPPEGRKTVSLAKVSFTQRPSFKIGACIARAASQMAGSPSVLKGSNFGDETLSVESFVSQLHRAATDPVKVNVVSEIAAGFFQDFRNSLASQQVAPEKVSNKRVKLSNSNVGGTEAFEFEEMGDTYWTDRVIHNGGEEQTTPTEKGDYQVVPVELKPAQVQRTRRPYRRRQSQISMPHSASEKPADFDENAPAEIIMNFSETDTIPPEKNLSKMFRHFGPIRESQTEVDLEKNRARVVFKKGVDAEVAYNSAGRFNIFGTKAVNYELSYTITETFKVQPYVVSLGEEDAAISLPS